MPLGLNRTDLNKTGVTYKNGTPINTATHSFGNQVNWTPDPAHFGNSVTTPVDFGNDVTWSPDPAHFGNNLALLPPVVTSGLMAAYAVNEGSGTTLHDLSGNGYNGTLAAGNAAPTWTSAGLSFDATKSQYVSLPSALNSALTIMVFCGFQQSGNTPLFANPYNEAIIAGSNIGSSSIGIYVSNFAGSALSPRVKNELSLMSLGWPYTGQTINRLYPQGINSVTLAMDTTDHIYVNGHESKYINTATMAGKQTTGNYQLGGATDGTQDHDFFFTGQIYYVLIYNRVLSPSEILANHTVVFDVLAQRGVSQIAAGTGSDFTIVADGDSITNGQGLTTPWPSLMTITGSPTIWIPATNAAVLTGASVSGGPILNPDAPTAVDPFFEINASKNACIIFAGTNDFANGDTARTVANDLWTYCDARRAAGWKVFVCTMLSRVSLDMQKNALNTFIRNEFSSHADVLIDMAANPNIGADGAYANATYFQDQIHPTQTGANILTSIGQLNINRFYGHSNFGLATTYTSSATQAQADWYTILGASAGSQTFALLSSVGWTNQNIYIKNNDSHSWTIAAAAGETINGSASITINPGQTLTLTCVLVSASAGGSNWTAA